MQTKPIFIGFTAAILILVVAAAAFFAGLSLGQRGYVDNLRYQSPQNVQGQPPVNRLPTGNNSPQSGPAAGQPAQSGIAPAGGPPGAPSWPPDVMGRLVTLTADSITLDTPQGQVTVAVNASTKITNETGQTLASTDLAAGDIVAVFGRDTATLLMRLPPRPNAP